MIMTKVKPSAFDAWDYGFVNYGICPPPEFFESKINYWDDNNNEPLKFYSPNNSGLDTISEESDEDSDILDDLMDWESIHFKEVGKEQVSPNIFGFQTKSAIEDHSSCYFQETETSEDSGLDDDFFSFTAVKEKVLMGALWTESGHFQKVISISKCNSAATDSTYGSTFKMVEGKSVRRSKRLSRK